MWFVEFYLRIGFAFIAWACMIGIVCMPVTILVLGLIEGLTKLPAGTKRTWHKTLYAILALAVTLKVLVMALLLNTFLTIGLALF